MADGDDLKGILADIERNLSMGNHARVRLAVNKLLHEYRRIRREYDRLHEASQELLDTNAHLRDSLRRTSRCLRISTERHRASLKTFERLRSVLSLVHSMHSLRELPDALEHMAETLNVDSVQLILSESEYGEFTPEPVLVRPKAEIASRLAQLKTWSAASGSFLGPVALVSEPAFFFGNGSNVEGSCFIRPMSDKYNHDNIIGAIALHDKSPNRYSKGKATDFLDHFCDLIAFSVVTVRDHDQLDRDSLLDPLTGVHNRRYLMRNAQPILDFATRKNLPVHLLFLDLDEFKPVNDTLGHGAGDRILRAVARMFRNIVRRYDILVRYGGDEFVVLSPDITEEDARLQAKRLQDAVSALSVAECCGVSTSLTVSASVGVAMYEPGQSMEELIKEADEDMYMQKRRMGKGR